MKEYKRLTAFNSLYTTNDGEHDIIVEIDKKGYEKPQYDYDSICQKLNRLVELENKICRGEIIYPKYPMYSTVFIIDYIDLYGHSVYGANITVRECFVSYITQSTLSYSLLYKVQPKDLPEDVLDGENENIEYWDKLWLEEKLFLTKSEAEAKLLELKGVTK